MAVSVYRTVFDNKHTTSHRGIRLEPEISCTTVRQLRLSCHAGEASTHSWCGWRMQL